MTPAALLRLETTRELRQLGCPPWCTATHDTEFERRVDVREHVRTVWSGRTGRGTEISVDITCVDTPSTGDRTPVEVYPIIVDTVDPDTAAQLGAAVTAAAAIARGGNR